MVILLIMKLLKLNDNDLLNNKFELKFIIKRSNYDDYELDSDNLEY